MGTNRRFTTRQKHRERSRMGKQYGQSPESPRAEAGKARVPFGGLSSASHSSAREAGRRLAHAPKDQFGRENTHASRPSSRFETGRRTYPRRDNRDEERTPERVTP